MEWRDVAENWPAFVKAIRTRWPDTEYDDVLALDGDREAFERYLSETQNIAPADAREQVAGWLEGAVASDVVMSDQMDDANIRDSGRHIPPGEDVYSEDQGFGDETTPERPIGRSD